MNLYETGGASFDETWVNPNRFWRFLAKSLRIVGIIGVLLGVGTVLWSTLLYIQDHEFSVYTTYLSDVGAAPGWPQVIFISGMLVISPVRYLFLVLLVLRLDHLGAGRAFSISALTVGLLVVIGSIGLSAVPHSLSLTVHKMSALLYFFGVVILQTLIAGQEFRRRLAVVLPLSSLAVVAVYLIFAVLLSMIGKIEGITRNTPVIWEWLAFCSLMGWLIVHSVFLGDARTTKQLNLFSAKEETRMAISG